MVGVEVGGGLGGGQGGRQGSGSLGKMNSDTEERKPSGAGACAPLLVLARAR